jgi:hypothetical protein
LQTLARNGKVFRADGCRDCIRVCQVNGSIFIVSHGSPHHRKAIFKKIFPLDEYEIRWSKQGISYPRTFYGNGVALDLSDFSQLINVFRTNLKDKPLAAIVKDKEALEKSMRDRTPGLSFALIEQ